MSYSLKPTTKSGKLSVGFLIGFGILFGISQIVYLGTTIGKYAPPSWANPIIGVIGLSGFLCAIIALLAAGWAFFKEKEKSPVIFLAFLFGLFALTFIVGEFVFPH